MSKCKCKCHRKQRTIEDYALGLAVAITSVVSVITIGGLTYGLIMVSIGQ